MVQLIIVTKEFILLQLTPRHLEKLLEELTKPREVQVVLLEELVADGGSTQLHDKVIHGAYLILDLSGIVSRHFMRLHLFTVWLFEPSR